MKKLLGYVAGFIIILGVFGIPGLAAEANRLYAIDADRVESITVRSGNGSKHVLDAAQEKERISKVIEALNQFEYTKVEELPPATGWYLSLSITDVDGGQQEIELGVDRVIERGAEGSKVYISADSQYFGDSFLKLAFSDPFTDVNLSAGDSLRFLKDNGLMLGTSKTTFSPDELLTRGMFFTVLGRMAGVDPTAYPESVFEDVPQARYYAPYLSWGGEIGLIQQAGGSISPDAPVTREEAVVYLVRYAQARQVEYQQGYTSVPAFTDLETTSQEFRDNLTMMVKAGIVPWDWVGMKDQFYPQKTVTRKEGVDLFYSTCSALSLT